ncbi:GNAT family N-acetyltransferase [Thalassospira mesophila]|uniref:GNAT family N-acetyltransferase n=1 Tax=Thalassospira mesophila TaxID=1293891 RepID=UPI0013028FB9|nr:GNAT family N-acetyltransferase [Thalassospira mesophila]
MAEVFEIRSATRADCQYVSGMSNDLHVELDYANPPHSALSIKEMMFGPRPLIESLIAFNGDRPVGQTIFQPFYNPDYSAPGLWMTELYVVPDFRSAKVGKMLMVALAKLALERRYVSIWWSVLQSNHAACRFYHRIGARNSGAVQYEIDGETLASLARGNGPQQP